MRYPKLWQRFALLSTILTASLTHVAAADPVDSPSALIVETAKFELTGPRARQQLVVSGRFGEHLRDVTHLVELTSSDPNVVRIDGTRALPVSDGAAQITVKLGDQSAAAEVTVKHAGVPAPVRFNTELLAALTKSGCNMEPVTDRHPAKGASVCRCEASIPRSTS